MKTKAAVAWKAASRETAPPCPAGILIDQGLADPFFADHLAHQAKLPHP